MVKIIIGIDSREKNNFILDNIYKSYQEEKRQVFVIVPEQFTLSMEQMLIEHFESSGLMGIEVTSLTCLINRISADLINSKKTVLTALGRKLLIKKIVSNHLNDLKVYYKSYNKLGLIHEIEHVLASFYSEKISVDDIKNLNVYLRESDLLSRKLNDLILIYDTYRKVVDEEFIDESKSFELFIKHIDMLPELKNSDIYLYGFSGFSKQELEIIQAISNKANKMIISINYHENYNKNIFSFTSNTLKQLQGYFSNYEQITYKDDLEVFDFAIGMSQYNEMKIKHQLEVFTGKNIYSECRYVASAINRLLIRDKIDINDINIMLIDPETYSTIITRELQRYNIPYFADEKRTLKNTNIIKAMISLLEFYQKNLDTKALINYLKAISSTEELLEIDLLENFALSNGIKGNRWLKKFDSQFFENLRIKHVANLTKWNKKFIKPQSVESFSNLFVELLTKLNIKELIDREIESLKSHNLEDEILILTQVWNKFTEIIDQIREASGNQKISLEQYIDYLIFSFEDEKVVLIPSINEGVKINVLGRSVYLPSKVTFLMGMNENNLPREHSESKVLTEADKEIFYNFGFNLNDDLQFYKTKEILDFFTILAKSENKIYFTLSSSGKDGKAIKPSYYIERARHIVENIVEKDDMIDDYQIIDYWLYNFDMLKINIIKQLRQFRQGYELTDKWISIISAFKEKYVEDYNKLIDNVFYDNQSEKINKSNENGKLFTSISRLERYAKCPYAYFAQYDLKLKDRKEYKVSYSEIGNLYHEAMELIVNDIISGVEIPKDSTKYIDEKVDFIISKKEYQVFNNRYETQYFVKRAKNLIEKIIGNIQNYYEDSEFNPKYTEIDFTHKLGKSNFDPVIVKINEEQEIVIEGKIDRIDIFKNDDGKIYCNIIDYKTGIKKLQLDHIIKGIDYQLAVYILASLMNQESLAMEEIIPSGVLYYRIHDDYLDMIEKSIDDIDEKESNKYRMQGLILDDIEVLKMMDKSLVKNGSGKYIHVKIKKDGTLYSGSAILNEKGFEYLLNLTKENIRKVGLKILEGEISILPIKENQEDACQFCNYKNICKFEIDFYNNEYKYIDTKSNSSVIEKIYEAIGSENHD